MGTSVGIKSKNFAPYASRFPRTAHYLLPTRYSEEPIFLWDPDVIFAWKKGRGGFFEEISGNSDWQKLRAVRSGEVYGVPDNPFCWFDRPPSVNRVLGLRWASHLLYPEVFPRNMIEEAQKFYDLFWHYRLSEDEARQILEGSLRRP